MFVRRPILVAPALVSCGGPTPTTASAPGEAEQSPCTAGLDTVEIADALARRARLSGRRIAVRGVLQPASPVCTEDACDNECTFGVQLGAAPEIEPLLVFGANRGEGDAFVCRASAGDPCTGDEHTQASEPSCLKGIGSAAEVVVVGVMSRIEFPPVLADPPAAETWALTNARLCPPSGH